MKVSWNWLRELVEIALSPEALADRLSLAGLAVDSIETIGRHERVVAATIVGVAQHPESDRLKLCRVDAGPSGTFQVVSGAPGIEAGQRIVLALPGASLAGGTKVEPAEIRGQRSEAVLLSERELGISEDHSGLMQLSVDAVPGAPIGDVLGTADIVLEIDVTPNRGDCLSILGIAREVAAITGQRIRRQSTRVAEKGEPAASRAAVEIRDPDLCRRYVARVIDGVAKLPSPLWMRSRLEAVGLRPIDLVVDVTNYVMIESGQPLHAFDLERLAGHRIVVRRAAEGETITTLDGALRTLGAADLVIADAERPVAVAGLMGGAESGVSDSTRTVLLESAWFDPSAIRRTARKLGLQSDAAYRFERGVDPEGLPAAADRAAELLSRLGRAAVAPGAIDLHPRPRERTLITVRTERVNALLGGTWPAPEIGQILRRVSASVKAAGRGGFLCSPPSWRHDLTREADFIEEVARLGGYDRIPETRPLVPLEAPAFPAGARLDRAARAALVAQGMSEMVHLRFTTKAWNDRLPGWTPLDAASIRLANPLSQETEEMIRSLVPNLLGAVVRNRNQGERRVRGFELGRAFWRGPSGIVESRRVAGVLCGRILPRGIRAENREESFADLKGVVEALLQALGLASVRWRRDGLPSFLHPGKSALLEIAGAGIGYAGALHPVVAEAADLASDVWVFELDSEKLGSYAPARSAFRPLPRFPMVSRDLAIVADESFEAARVAQALSERADLLVEEVRLFDVYRGDPIPRGRKSLAYAISYRASDRTLTDAEAGALHHELTELLRTELGVEPRG